MEPLLSRTLPAASLDVVLLTAGSSSRLGQPKQHVMMSSKSLLERAVSLACDVLESLPSPGKPIVVSGAFLQQDCIALAHRHDHRPIEHRYNSRWHEGMSASLDLARSATTADGVMILLVDQYEIQLNDLLSLHALWLAAPMRAAAAGYAGTVGPPLIWPRQLWNATTGKHAPFRPTNKTALLATNPQVLAMPNASADLDTRAQLDALTR